MSLCMSSTTCILDYLHIVFCSRQRFAVTVGCGAHSVTNDAASSTCTSSTCSTLEADMLTASKVSFYLKSSVKLRFHCKKRTCRYKKTQNRCESK